MSRAPADVQIALCGLGGQGIVFLSRVVAGAAEAEGREVLAAETHGMSQRGGAVEAHVKIGRFECSLVRRGCADLVLVLDASRADAARALLAPGGAGVASARVPVPGLTCLDAAEAARGLGFPRGQNLVLLGYAAVVAADRLPSPEALRLALERLSPPAACEANRRAFEHGTNLAS